MRKQRFIQCVVTGVCLLWSATFASAQGTAGISGIAKDATGAVLPGATVEASSPALIEKVRTVTTDGAGQYKIVSLPPGVYTVTVTLAGFSAVKREGIELVSGFNATVNAELRIGAVEETVTVTGQSAVVDVQSSKRQVVMTRDVVDALPTGKALVEIATLIPGVQMMNGTSPGTGMGGSAGMDQFATLTAHGARSGDTKLEVAGMDVNIFGNRQDSTYANFQDGNVQEYAVEVSGQSAESESGGVRVNLIPKEGGNNFSGSLFVNYANSNFQTDNMTDALRATGLRDPDHTKSLWSVNPSIGGPIIRDRLWFYGGYARTVNRRYKAGIYTNLTPGGWRPTFDLTQQAIAGDQTHDSNIRLTFQATAKQKFSFYYDENHLCQCPYLIGAQYTGINTPEASNDAPRLTRLPQITWTAPFTSRLLFEAAASLARFTAIKGHEGNPYHADTVGSRKTEATTGISMGAPSVDFDDFNSNNTLRAAVTYATGTHAAKFGATVRTGGARNYVRTFGNQTFATLNFRPTSVTYAATPYTASLTMSQAGLFAQDQWTLKRMTLNLGLRWDYYTQGTPDQHLEPSLYVPTARDFSATTLVRWRDLDPRAGVAFDLFGNGKTAIKGSLGRFIIQQTVLNSLNPARANLTMTRSWSDPNGDFIIQGDPFNPAANGELGASQNVNFGKPIITTNLDPNVAFGYGVRPSNWEGSVTVQQQLMPRVSMTASYYRRWYQNFQVTDNLLVSPADYETYCVARPTDSRLPGGLGGQQICGLFDLKPAKVGQVNTLTTAASNFGTQTENWNGIDVSLNARLAHNVLLTGGVSTGRTKTNNCDVVSKVDNPSTYNCSLTTPYLKQIKFGGSYTLPWDVQISGTLQSFQGPSLAANTTFTNAQIAPSLGRNLSSGTTATVNILPGIASAGNVTQAIYYGDRISQVDLRFAKTVRLGSYRIKGMFDLYNALNINTPTILNITYGTTGATWLQPTGISLARLVKLGVQVDF